MMISISRYFVLSAALIGFDAMAEFDLSTAKPVLNEGLSVICEMHGATPNNEREGWWKMVHVHSPHRLIFKANSATDGLIAGEVYIESSDGARVATLSLNTFWLPVTSLEWKIGFSEAGVLYDLIVNIPDKSGLLYQDGTVKSFMRGCQFIKKPGLPPIN